MWWLKWWRREDAVSQSGRSRPPPRALLDVDGLPFERAWPGQGVGLLQRAELADRAPLEAGRVLVVLEPLGNRIVLEQSKIGGGRRVAIVIVVDDDVRGLRLLVLAVVAPGTRWLSPPVTLLEGQGAEVGHRLEGPRGEQHGGGEQTRRGTVTEGGGVAGRSQRHELLSLRYHLAEIT